ncbi:MULTISPECIES: glycosyltransferase [Methylomonas]|uniref:Family 2 glycosyl transferase n=2 Tax=Methylomonas TaxID=416 RepID=A0A126T2V5_9GAMM|nr:MULTISPECIES: glycosyltransferase [Methylomonas]AMK76407.1 family 2 glycosyl transferase [Methylomonas denitrificans]OAH98666.1 family 2 glycosyl transferase [Methylomonas methanica]TCV88436.1 glycosyl transferase family 2 [Methylomonas methanica]
MQNLTVSIISTVLNECSSIKNLLDAFLNQTRRPDEIVIVDGGSTDGTLELLQEYADQNANIKFFVEKGVNIARGRNLAITRSSSDIIAVTDGGCHPEPVWLDELVKPLLENLDFGAVSGVRKVEHINSFEFFAGALSTSGNATDEEHRVFHGRNSAFRKSVWAATGGYPEWLYTAEDTLFAQRAKALGCRVGLAQNAVVSWRPRPNFKKLAKQYYLYGRGTGRIGKTDLKAVFYHLRNHILWMLTFLLGFVIPWAWLAMLGVLAFIYISLIAPVIKELQDDGLGSPGLYWYVPIIVMIRSFYNNLGQLYGYWEYEKVEPFKKNLELYLSGQWKSTDNANS